MLTVHHISKMYSIEPVLDRVSFHLNAGQRIGLVGPNGCGKTTLLRILAGLELPDQGTVTFSPPNVRRGYLPQGFAPAPNETIHSFLARQQGDLEALSARLESLAAALASDPHQPDLQAEYDRVLIGLETTAQSDRRAAGVLASLGLGELAPEMPVEHLSGGQKTRLALGSVLLGDPQLLLLDEPTNHLDLDMLAWLEGWLLNFAGAVLVVSHDRIFLDRLATSILELDQTTHQARLFAGSYTAYLETRIQERERQWQAFKDQQDEIARLRAAASRVRSDAKYRPNNKAAGDTWAPGFFANRTKETIQKAKNIEKRIERMLTTDRVDKPRQSWQIKLDFEPAVTGGRDVLHLEGLSVGYGQTALLDNINLTLRHGARAALVGPNGCGKTTLLRTAAGEIPALAGQARLGANIQPGYMDQEQESLDPELNALENLRQAAPLPETEARAFLHRFLFAGDDVFMPAGLLSYGERARLTLACLVGRGCNFLMLDEPLNHLDIPARTRFEQALASFEGAILAVVHDRYFIQGFATEIWEVSGRQVRRIEQRLSI